MIGIGLNKVAMMKRVAHAICTALLVGLLATGAAAAQYTMKIAHAVPQGDPRDTAARYVAEKMNASETCDADAKVFPASQLGGTTDLIESMQIGSIELVVMSRISNFVLLMNEPQDLLVNGFHVSGFGRGKVFSPGPLCNAFQWFGI